jgi:Methyltransferase domain
MKRLKPSTVSKGVNDQTGPDRRISAAQPGRPQRSTASSMRIGSCLFVALVSVTAVWKYMDMSSFLEEDDLDQGQAVDLPSQPVCERNPYLMSLVDNADSIASRMDLWLSRKHMKSARKEAKTNKELLIDWNRFNYGFPTLAKCRADERVCLGGPCTSDESKITCGVRRMNPSCIVYSLGGNNQWAFEIDVLNQTNCEVHTFDCTGPAERFDQKPDRVHFHHVCLGTVYQKAPANCPAQKKCGETWTLQQMQSKLGHDRVDLLKVDIEGHEWPLVQSWWDQYQEEHNTSNAGNGSKHKAVALPHQIVMEVHFGRKKETYSPEDIVLFHEKLLRMGYIIVERDNNLMCKRRDCTEISLLRARCPPVP